MCSFNLEKQGYNAILGFLVTSQSNKTAVLVYGVNRNPSMPLKYSCLSLILYYFNCRKIAPLFSQQKYPMLWPYTY